jgi:hypothetical protein
MSKAWTVAKSAARRFNAPVRSFFAASLAQVWAEEKQARAEIAAVAARVRACVAGLAAEAREMERLTAEWCSRLSREQRAREQERERRRAATVLPFPSRRPVAVPAAPARRAA